MGILSRTLWISREHANGAILWRDNLDFTHKRRRIIARNNERNSMELCTTEFSVARATELYDRLEAKRREYLIRIKGSESSWDDSWYEQDLLARHDEDPNFRLRYYKFVLISILVIACQKHPQKIQRSDSDVDDIVSARCIGVDLSHALCRNLDIETFNEACEVISNYLTGVLNLESSGMIPTEPKNSAAT